MSFWVAVAGKGGTGKTTVTSMLVRYLLKKGRTPVLAIDADPNTNLPEVLGMQSKTTIAEVLKQIIEDPNSLPPGVAKGEYIEVKLEETMAEGEDVDLLVMGGPEGQGCYCFPNSLLRNIAQKLSKLYPFVIMDNEAGLEHLSRRTTDEVDLLLVISDASIRGVRSAARVNDLVRILDLKVKRFGLVITRAKGEPDGALKKEIEATGLPLVGVIPYDDSVVDYDVRGVPLVELPDESPVVRETMRMFDALLPEEVPETN